MKIDERASVPLGWVMAAFASTCVIVVPVIIAGAFKVFTVDARLERIEERLGIKGSVTYNVQMDEQGVQIIPQAFGDETKETKKRRK